MSNNDESSCQLEESDAKVARGHPAQDRLSHGHYYGMVQVSDNAKVQLGDQYYFGKSAEEDAVDKFCASLHFAEMFQRYESIEGRHGNTYEWILSEHPDNAAWDSFADWLEHGQQPYWISCKAGSSKSTLMKYLLDNVGHTLGAAQRQRLVLSYWFWEPGTELQRSLAVASGHC